MGNALTNATKDKKTKVHERFRQKLSSSGARRLKDNKRRRKQTRGQTRRSLCKNKKQKQKQKLKNVKNEYVLRQLLLVYSLLCFLLLLFFFSSFLFRSFFYLFAPEEDTFCRKCLCTYYCFLVFRRIGEYIPIDLSYERRQRGCWSLSLKSID